MSITAMCIDSIFIDSAFIEMAFYLLISSGRSIEVQTMIDDR
jgi:hypothetical protein